MTRYFGLLAFVILLCGLSFVVWKWPQGKHLTFSQHVARAKHTILYYILLFAITLPLLLVFFLQWFVPAFHLPVWFSICVVISAVMQQACTLIPEIGGWKTKYHQALAGISALFLLPPLFLLLFSPNISRAGKALTAVGLLTMLCVLGTAMVRHGRSYLLILQSAYYAAFFLPILFISYLQ